MQRTFIAMILLISVLLVACSNNIDSKEQKQIDVKELVDDYSVGKVTEPTASITSHELILIKDDDEKVFYDLSGEDFFVSIAPFKNVTHPCDIHSLTGCQGELVDQNFDVYIEDETGNVVIDEMMNSEANGFIDLWLPRDMTFNVTITHDDKEVSSEISTFENDNTCITTMQLM